MLRHRLGADLTHARDVAIASAYFLPSRGLSAAAVRVLRSMGAINLLLAGHSDVPLARLAAERLYGRLLARGVQHLRVPAAGAARQAGAGR